MLRKSCTNIQELQFSQREASNRNEMRPFSVCLVGCLQQDEVGPAHQVQVVGHRQVRGGATHLPALLAGQLYRKHLILRLKISNYLSVH